jgi:hypothetical protein
VFSWLPWLARRLSLLRGRRGLGLREHFML